MAPATIALNRGRPSARIIAAALVALLAANLVYFALFDSASKAVDSAAWLVLLILFLAETHFGSRLSRLTLRSLRLVAAAGVVAAALAYIVERNRLDAINSALWIGVIALLEAELRWPDALKRARTTFSLAAFVLYGGLAALVLVWVLRREWLDAYDAALWLIAFAALELEALSAMR